MTDRKNAWIMPLTRNQSGTNAVFCFPYAGAGASVFRGWANKLSIDTDLYAIQGPGRETRFSEPFIDSIESFAMQAANEIVNTAHDQDIILFGHSLGAACAYETAHALERMHHGPKLLIASGRQCPGTQSKRKPITHLADSEFLSQLQRYKGTPEEVIQNKELMELLLPLIRSDFSLAEHYRPNLDRLLECPIIAIGSSEDPWIDEQTLDCWRNLTRGDFEVKWFGGDHFYLNQRTQELICFLREKIAALPYLQISA